MDDTAQSNNQAVSDVPVQDDTHAVALATPPVSSASVIDDSATAQVQPVPIPQSPVSAPISGPSKEHAPLVSPPDEYITATESKPEIAAEVKEAGVVETAVTERPVLTPDQKDAGIEHAKDAVPVQATPTGKITFPITKEEVKMIHKKHGWKDSFRWLFDLMVKVEDEKALAKKE